MSVVVLALLIAVVVSVVGSMVAMFVKNESFYGAMGLCVLLGPGTLLAFLYVALADAWASGHSQRVGCHALARVNAAKEAMAPIRRIGAPDDAHTSDEVSVAHAGRELVPRDRLHWA
jgi:hypothetical protein